MTLVGPPISSQSLLVTQLTVPETSSAASFRANGYTYNVADNVFNDDATVLEFAVVTGSTTAGSVLSQKMA